MAADRPSVGHSERPDLPLAVIVGAGGMGVAIARRLGQSNRLFIVDRDQLHLDQVAATLRGEGYDVKTCRCDVTSDKDVTALTTQVQTHGALGVLVHVVGLSPSMGDFDTLVDVNLVGAARIADAFLPIAAPGCAAIFISSMAGHLRAFESIVEQIMDAPLAPDFVARLKSALDESLTSDLAYLLSKSTMIRMCKRKASAWGQRGARIVSLSPGLIATPMGALEFERQPMKYDLLAATPLGREGTMHEIADAVEFLASSKASFINGVDLLVDGGLTATLQSKS
jgi:NAD(P)-dependent dehydrogenase (short-subunit alcohol dehydrogenase family)